MFNKQQTLMKNIIILITLLPLMIYAFNNKDNKNINHETDMSLVYLKPSDTKPNQKTFTF